MFLDSAVGICECVYLNKHKHDQWKASKLWSQTSSVSDDDDDNFGDDDDNDVDVDVDVDNDNDNDDDDDDEDAADSKEFPLVRPIHRSLGIDPNHSCPQRLVKYGARLMMMMKLMIVISMIGMLVMKIKVKLACP